MEFIVLYINLIRLSGKDGGCQQEHYDFPWRRQNILGRVPKWEIVLFWTEGEKYLDSQTLKSPGVLG